MKEVISDISLVAKCGLYCGSCTKFLKEKCPGCAKNEKASWCAVRSCCIENNLASCAECKQFDDIMQCKKYNNFMAKLFGIVFRSDRKACIDMIREKGYESFALYMAVNKVVTMKKSNN